MSEMETARTEDWSRRATDTVVGYVDTVRSATTGRALLVSRLAVYFLAIGLIALVVVMLLLVMLVRGLVALSAQLSLTDPGEVFLAYWLLGVVFCALGAFLWSKRGR